MKKSNTNRNDKLLAEESTTGSYGTSVSTNITSASSGTDGDNSTSLFPNFKEEKKWSSKTIQTVKQSK